MGIEMKKLIVLAVLFGAAYSGFAAAAEISGNIALTTEYRFRGISQTNRDPAVQGGFDWGHDSGFYVGTWASNVSFTEGGTEIDVYAGWGADLSENFALDLGVLYYGYPSDEDADYVEVYGSLGFFGATLGLNYSPEYTYDTGDYFYLYGSYSLPLGEIASLDLQLGLNQFEDSDALGSFLGAVDPGKSYLDYSIGATVAVAGVDLTLAYVGTDIDKDDCFPATFPPDGSGTKYCEGNAVFTISKTL
jgi:uncharacterized protein (TIGR02001 family)